MTDARWSIKNALRLSRGTRNAIERARIKHGKRPLVAKRLVFAHRAAVALVRELEAALGAARHDAAKRRAA